MKQHAFTRVLFFPCSFLVAAIILFAGSAAGQTRPGVPVDQLSADENFELNIGESREVEQFYKRSTSVDIHTPNLSVGVGAEVRAQRIDLRLRGVSGRVLFRATLESLQHLIERARALPNR